MRWVFDAAAEEGRRQSDRPEPPPRTWPRWWAVGTAAGLIAPIALIVLPSETRITDFLALATALIGLVVLLGAALTMTRWPRTVWWSFLAFQLLTMVSLGMEAITHSRGEVHRFPEAADVVALLAYLPALLALGLLIRHLYPGRDREAWIDASILTVTLASVMGLFVIRPALDSPGAASTSLLSVAFPILDLVLISALVWLLVGTRRPTPTLVLITLSLTATLAADVTRDLLLTQPARDGYDPTITALRLAALTITAAAAWTPTSESFAGQPTSEDERTGAPRLTLLAVGVLIVPVIVVTRLWPTAERATLLLALAALVIIILAVWRIQILVTTVQQQRQVTELVLDSAGDGIVGLDREGFVLFANLAARRMLRCREADLLGHRFHDLAHHEYPDGRPFPWQECPIHGAVIGGGAAVLSDQRYIRRDGTAFPVEIIMTPLVVDGEPAGAVQSFRDVSEREHLEEVKRQFVSVVSHELRTPLTSIKGSLRMLDSGLMGGLTDDQQELVTMAVANSDRLGVLVNDILDIERLDAGMMPLVPELVAAIGLGEQAMTGMTGAADAAGVNLEREFTSDEAFVLVDPGRMIQVLTNLVGNAIKFSERGSAVRMVIQRGGDHVRFDVVDSGRGIPADRLDSVFARFGQVEAGDSRRDAGTGLGLAIAQELVKRSGGTLSVDSTVGVGSTFTVLLPVARRTDAESSDPVPEEATR